MAEIKGDLNAVRPIGCGGTGATSAEEARSKLGVPTITVNDVGSLCFCRTDTLTTNGATRNGSSLSAAGITSAGALTYTGTPLPGVWRCLGSAPINGASLFVRVS